MLLKRVKINLNRTVTLVSLELSGEFGQIFLICQSNFVICTKSARICFKMISSRKKKMKFWKKIAKAQIKTNGLVEGNVKNKRNKHRKTTNLFQLLIFLFCTLNCQVINFLWYFILGIISVLMGKKSKYFIVCSYEACRVKNIKENVICL